MSGFDHIVEGAAGLASLPAADPERVAAYAHARECRDCARALAQAERLFAALDNLPAMPLPPAPVIRSIRRPILSRLAVLALPTGALSIVLGVVWVLLLAMAKHRAGGGVAWVESATLLGAALGCLPLLRRSGRLAAALAFGASMLAAAVVWGEGPLAPRVGVACLLTELGAAALPVAIAVRAFVRRRSMRPTVGLVVAAAAGALVGQAALCLTCPDRTAGLHVMVFHCGGVLAAAATALVAARFLARPVDDTG